MTNEDTKITAIIKEYAFIKIKVKKMFRLFITPKGLFSS